MHNNRKKMEIPKTQKVEINEKGRGQKREKLNEGRTRMGKKGK